MKKKNTGKKTRPPKLVEITNPTVIITIRAEIPLGDNGDDSDDNAESSIAEALDALRGYGTADIISRKIVGTPVSAGKKR